MKGFERRAKPFRIIGDPDNQLPDKWSSTIHNGLAVHISLFCVNALLYDAFCPAVNNFRESVRIKD
jgi:hypothetical protein